VGTLALTIAGGGLVVLLAYLLVSVFEKTRVPDVLFLLAIGIVLGPVTGLIQASQFGVLGSVFTTVTLIVVLFEAGTTLSMRILRTSAGPAAGLAVLSFFVTMAVTTATALWLTDLDLMAALILGAVVGSTSESIVIPLIRQMKVGEKTQAILSMESSMNDVLAIVIALALISSTKEGTVSVSAIEKEFLSSFLVAIIFGIIGGLLWTVLRMRIKSLRESTLTTPAFVFVTYGIVEVLGFNGAIAALAFGITLGNFHLLRGSFFRKASGEGQGEQTPALSVTEKVIFRDLAFVLKSFFFLYVGISLRFTGFRSLAVGLVLVAFAFVLRALAVKITAPKGTSPGEASIMAIMIPKGLAAIVLAGIPLSQGVLGGEQIMNITYTVVFFSVVGTAIIAFAVDRTRFGKLYRRFYTPFLRSNHDA
jgi:potassium/hydrogen antiporter